MFLVCEVYPKVKVRLESEDDDMLKQGWRSLLSLKDIQFLCLQKSWFPAVKHEEETATPTARIPKSYVPSVTLPAVSSSEGSDKSSDIEHEDRPNIRASSIPPPRAVLSSPENDVVIGNINKTKLVRHSRLQNQNPVQNRHTQCKQSPANRSPINTKKSDGVTELVQNRHIERKLTPANRSAINTKKSNEVTEQRSESKGKKGPATTMVSNLRRKIGSDKLNPLLV